MTLLRELPLYREPTSDCSSQALAEPVAHTDDSRRLPRWLKREVPKGNFNHLTQGLLDELKLETVCDNAKCPNRMRRMRRMKVRRDMPSTNCQTTLTHRS